jgi:redox-sensitive bicupin YhaK (pirin superfamily)
MITVRPSDERGVANLGWLDSRHTFSFGHYYDPQQMGFGPLRVINEDRVRPGAGFDTHGHRDMEIISYVLEGALEHKDSIGTGSEFNDSKQEPVHFLQIWVLPDREGISSRYDRKTFSESEKRGRLRLIGSPDGRDGSIVIHQDVEIFAALLDAGDAVTHAFAAGRKGWVQVVRGAGEVNGKPVRAGDGVARGGEATLAVTSRAGDSEFLVFDLPPQ